MNEINVTLGHKLILDLGETPCDSGYLWNIENVDGLKIDVNYIDKNDDSIGGRVNVLAKIEAMSVGEYDLKFTLSRPW